MLSVFYCPEIECAGCAKSIERALTRRIGVDDVRVDVAAKTVDVQYNPGEIAESDIKRLLSMLGFPSQDRFSACAC